MKHILGISALYHDSAAVLLKEGDIVAAAQEERFTRLKNDHRFPEQAIDFCLKQAGITPSDLDAIAFYEKPITKFSRMLETYLAIAPRGWRTFPRVMSSWLSEKIQIKQTLGEIFSDPGTNCPIFFAQHHESHAASAFYPSPFEEAAILTIDGVGEWATTTLASGKGKHVEILKEIRFPHSLGLLYSTITAFCGFRVNSGEYKLMGLAPYGKAVYADILRENVIQIHEDGSFHLNLDYFAFLSSDQMDHPRLHALLEGPPRQPDTPMEERFMDIAASIQAITEEIMIKLARHAHAVTHVDDSARVQSVSETTNPLFYRLLKTFEKQTGCPALINTSFNVRGEPIVCSPKDAYDCFMNTEMDILVIGPCVLKKEEQSQQAPKPSFHPVPD